ncbi:hypothetical protein DFQ27_004317 [Actinomortierella ambigua]|uniref:Uncharacterized protein n=1 Tax=Actinomortierella ambigua TaxID=1343610 RepID=A0A9P6UCL6_9FUNG|nr:hypothetical protein DFQ27_004317 [Actinomortierella ambigua]
MPIQTLAQKSLPFTAFQTVWVPGTNRICAVGANDAGFGVIQVYQARSRAISVTKSNSSTSSGAGAGQPASARLELYSEVEKRIQFKAATFRASTQPSHLVTGDFEGRIGVWDLERTEVPVTMIKAHEDVVNCIDGAGAFSGRPEVVSGCRDGAVKMWDLRQKSDPVCTMVPKKGYEQDIWTVVMGNATSVDDLHIAAGYDNGDIRVFDLRAAANPVFETNVTHGICSLEFDRRVGTASQLVATDLEGSLHSFDWVNNQVQSMESMVVQTGDDSTLWQVRHLPQSPSHFAVTDGGGHVHLYSHGNASSSVRKLESKRLAGQGILTLEFNEDLEGLFICSDLENTLRLGLVDMKKD